MPELQALDTRAQISARSAIAAPTALCAAMLVIASWAVLAGGIDASELFLPYVSTALAVTLVSSLTFILIAVGRLARVRADRPIAVVAGALRERAPFLLLPGIIFPLFLAGFTATKTAIPFVVGYEWERFWADADKLIFGADVWRITHSTLPSFSVPVLEWFYTMGWGAALVFSAALIALYASARNVAIFFTAMLATWLTGGCLAAYGFSAAGPVFAHLVDPTLADRFHPLRETLSSTLVGDSPVLMTQAYLEGAWNARTAVKGGGISAMPSMHIGAASIYVLAAWRTKWLAPALLFWALIFVASGHFGYHYWLDGVAAAAIAWLCWSAAARLHNNSAPAVRHITVDGERAAEPA